MSWRGTGGGIAAAKAGHDVVMAPTSHTYFDYRQHADELGLGGKRIVAGEGLRFEPIPTELNAEQARHVLGGQGQLWGELIADRQRRDFMTWPRACALVETLWSPQDDRNVDLFLIRLETHLKRLKAAGIGYRPLDPTPMRWEGKSDDNAPQAAGALLGRLLPDHVDRFAFEVIPPEAGRDVFEIETARRQGRHPRQHGRLHGDGSQLVPQALLPLPRLVVRQPVEPARSAADRQSEGAEGQLGQTSLLSQLLLLRLLAAVVGLGAVGAADRLDGAQRRQRAAGGHRSGGGLAGGWQAVGTERRPDHVLPCRAAVPAVRVDGLPGRLGRAAAAKLDRPSRGTEQEDPRPGTCTGHDARTAGIHRTRAAAVAEKYPEAKLHEIHWIEWETHLLDPLDPLFAEIANQFMEEQIRRFGTDHLYAADTFIEMTPPSGDLDYLERLGRAIYDGMAKSDPQAVWVLQGWAFMYQKSFWTQPRIEAFLAPVPDERMLVLDLFCESTPMWSQTEAFCGKPWLWCNVQNFGCTVHLGGALDRNNDGLHAARTDPNRGSLLGLGFVNEGLGYNPVAYDLMFEMAWRNEALICPSGYETTANTATAGRILMPRQPGRSSRTPSTLRRIEHDRSSIACRRLSRRAVCPTTMCNSPVPGGGSCRPPTTWTKSTPTVSTWSTSPDRCFPTMQPCCITRWSKRVARAKWQNSERRRTNSCN